MKVLPPACSGPIVHKKCKASTASRYRRINLRVLVVCSVRVDHAIAQGHSASKSDTVQALGTPALVNLKSYCPTSV